jgi:hypothetical protein
MGDHFEKLDLFFKIIEESPLPISSIYLTHMGRNEQLYPEAKKWIEKGFFFFFLKHLKGIKNLIFKFFKRYKKFDF